MILRSCTKKDCAQENPQPLKNFYVGKNKNTWCKSCNRQAQDSWRSRNRTRSNELSMESYRRHRERRLATMRATYPDRKAKLRNHKLKKFGLNLERYAAMLAAQGGVCAICKRPEPAKDPRTGAVVALAVDHCHATGKVRGLLCCRCNRMLGLAGDRPEILLSATAYLAKGKL